MCVGEAVVIVLSRKSDVQGSRNSILQDPDVGGASPSQLPDMGEMI